MKLIRFRKLLLSSLFLGLPFQSVSIFADEILNKDSSQLLITQNSYREHEDDSENENDPHSKNHSWKDHYHLIRSVRLKKNGNLKIRFCEKVELLEGYVLADDIKYNVEDAYKIRKRSITWRLRKKNTFAKGDQVFINTANFLGRPIEKDPNPNEIRILERGCGLPFIYLPPGVEVQDDGNPIGLLGLIIAIGVAAGGGSGGSSSTSSN